MDDDDLVARVAAGDDAALRDLFGRHAPWLAARLRAVLPAADVEDVLQETFLAAGAPRNRPGPRCPPAWRAGTRPTRPRWRWPGPTSRSRSPPWARTEARNVRCGG